MPIFLVLQSWWWLFRWLLISASNLFVPFFPAAGSARVAKYRSRIARNNNSSTALYIRINDKFIIQLKKLLLLCIKSSISIVNVSFEQCSHIFLRWLNFHGQKNLLNLEIIYGSEKDKREPPKVWCRLQEWSFENGWIRAFCARDCAINWDLLLGKASKEESIHTKRQACTGFDEEKLALQKRVKELEVEREILKKALGIFSRPMWRKFTGSSIQMKGNIPASCSARRWV